MTWKEGDRVRLRKDATLRSDWWHIVGRVVHASGPLTYVWLEDQTDERVPIIESPGRAHVGRMISGNSTYFERVLDVPTFASVEEAEAWLDTHGGA